MKYTLVSLIALVASASASELEERGTPKKCDKYAEMIPKCARSTIISCTKKAGCPDPTKYACGCKHQKQITKCATPGVINKCGNKAAAAASAAQKICDCVNGS